MLKSVGIDAEADAVNKVVSALQGKALHEVIAAGLGKVATLSVGGGAGASSGSSAPAQNNAKAAAAKVVEEEPKKEEDDDLGGGLDLFGF